MKKKMKQQAGVFASTRTQVTWKQSSCSRVSRSLRPGWGLTDSRPGAYSSVGDAFVLKVTPAKHVSRFGFNEVLSIKVKKIIILKNKKEDVHTGVGQLSPVPVQGDKQHGHGPRQLGVLVDSKDAVSGTQRICKR